MALSIYENLNCVHYNIGLTINNKNINKAMVADGYAWAYREYLKDQDYLSIEEQARSHSIGIWSQPSPIYPSDFRHNKANTPAVTQSQPIQKQQ